MAFGQRPFPFGFLLFDYSDGDSTLMSNLNWPHGFRPLMENLQGAPVGVSAYAKPATDSNAIFQFDVVRQVVGSTNPYGEMIGQANCQTYATATPGTTPILGVALSFGAASKATFHNVVDDPFAISEAQADSTTAITMATVGSKNANINNTAQTNGGLISAMQVSSASIATTAGLDLKIKGLSRRVGNTEAANAILEVLFMRPQLGQGIAGV